MIEALGAEGRASNRAFLDRCAGHRLSRSRTNGPIQSGDRETTEAGRTTLVQYLSLERLTHDATGDAPEGP